MAYNARIGGKSISVYKRIGNDVNELTLRLLFLGIRLLDGEVTDLVESMALSFRPDFIDIYSASW